MKIRLETGNGEFVAEKEILPFQEAPAVVLWGIRHFILWRAMNQVPIYREVFCFTIVDMEVANGTGN